MARTFGLIALAALLLGLAGSETTGDTTPQPPKKNPAKKADPTPATEPAAKHHRVEKSLFKIEVSLKGTLEAAEMTEVAFKHHGTSASNSSGSLTVVKAVEHGAQVKKGDILIAFDLKKIDLALRDLEADRKLAELALQVAREEFPVVQKTLPLDLEAAERAKKQADDDLKLFLAVGRAQTEKTVQFSVKQGKIMLENARDELRHLVKMYKANDLTEETEEIVLKRQRNAVESAAFFLESAEIRRDQTLKVTLPRQELTLKEAATRMDLALVKAKKTHHLLTLQKELTFKKLEYEDNKAAERLDDLRKDREAMTVKAPVDGVVYWGKCANGQWSPAPKLAPGSQAAADEILMTIVKARPLLIRTMVEEKDVQHIRPGLKGKAQAVFNPNLKLIANVSRIASVPASAGHFEALFNLDCDKSASALMPGMACTIKLVPYLKKDTLAVPTAAVHNEEADEDKAFVFVVGKDGKNQKRTVTLGLTSGERVEVLSGLEEGEKILLDRPSEQPAGESAKKVSS